MAAVPVTKSAAEAITVELIESINRHDVLSILNAYTNDHIFTDSLGKTVSGVGNLERAWQGYFQIFPDYRMEIDTIAAAGGTVLMADFASGSKRGAGAPWRIPAAWRAEVRNGQVSAWQVYADTGPVQELMKGALGVGPT